MVVLTTWAVVRRLKVQSVAGVVLAGYIVGFATIVAIALALSVVRSLDRWTLLTAEVVVLAALLGPWLGPATVHRPLRDGLASVRSALGDPVVAILAGAVSVGLVYSAALGVLTPPNDWDSMSYHLARAAFWIQQHAVAYVPETHIVPINAYPPNGEIGLLFTMILSEGDRFVWVVQYTALLATALGTYGISCRIGLGSRAALFGALLFVTTPVVVLQGSSALNDLVVASFLVAATYFLLGDTRHETALGALALALAVGAKFTALVALPLLALVVFGATPRRRWPELGLASLIALGLGSSWLILNLVSTGTLDGGAEEALDQRADRGLRATMARLTRMLVNFADGMRPEWDVFVYVLGAVAFVLLALVLERGRGRKAWAFALGIAVVACAPLVVPLVQGGLINGHERLWLALGEHDLAALDPNRNGWPPSSVFSYYGPLGFGLVVGAPLLVVREVRRGRLRRLAVALSAAPLVLAVLMAVAISYDPYRGRFFMVAVALAASTWGVVLRWRWLAWGLMSIATTTLLLAFVHSVEKPAGIRLIDGNSSPGVWGKPREVVQAWLQFGGTSEVLQFFARQPESGRVGLVLEEDDWVYPFFGRTLGREVFFVSVDENLDGLDWLVIRAGGAEQPGPEWELALESSDGWRVFRRSAG